MHNLETWSLTRSLAELSKGFVPQNISNSTSHSWAHGKKLETAGHLEKEFQLTSTAVKQQNYF